MLKIPSYYFARFTARINWLKLGFRRTCIGSAIIGCAGFGVLSSAAAIANDTHAIQQSTISEMATVKLPMQQRHDFNQLALWGSLKQGALLRGVVAKGSQVWLQDKPVQVSAEGYFAIGFGRDANLQHTLRWQLTSGQQHSAKLILAKREGTVI